MSGFTPPSSSSKGRALLAGSSASTSKTTPSTSLKPPSSSSKGRALLAGSSASTSKNSSSISKNPSLLEGGHTSLSKVSENSELSSNEELLHDMENDFVQNGNAITSTSSVNSSGNNGKLYTAKMCFLLDVTGSMEPQRNAVISKIFDIVDRSEKKFPDVNIEVACVGYRDVDVSSSMRYEVIEFTKNTEDFCEQLAGVKCTGGDDEAEDVLGGMDVVLNKLDWSGARIKVMFHIGDSPHHGTIFHDQAAGGCNDHHTDLVQTPRPYDDILGDFADQHIDYNFGLVKNPRGDIKTREMARLFEQSYNACQSKSNRFGLMDLSDFSPDQLFDKVLTGLTGSINSFMAAAARRH